MYLALVLAILAQSPEGFGGEEDDGSLVHIKAVEAALRKRLAEDKVRLRFLQNEESSLLRGLAGIDRRLLQQHRASKSLSDERRKLEVRISRADEELQKNAEALDELRHRIGRRAAAMMRLKKTPILGLLSRASTPVEHRRLKERLRMVLSFDAGLVAELRTRSEEAERLRQSLRDESSSLEATTLKLEEEIATSLDLRAERDALLGAIRRERKLVDRLAREIRDAAKTVSDELGALRGTRAPPPLAPGGLEAQQGRLPWPTVGRVEVPFGKQVDPETGMVLVHRGIDLRAAHGRPVSAVFSGVVRHAREVPGFGRLVLLEHEGRWYSAYGQLGAKVLGGEALGTVGDTGSDKGPHLYFELRRGRRAVDPLPWLAD